MLKLSANLGFLWSDLPLLARISSAAKAGFKAVEMHWPYATDALEVRRALDANKLTLLSINTVKGDVAKGDNGLAALANREAEFQAAIDQSIAYADKAGARFIHAMAGIVDADEVSQAAEVLHNNLDVAADKAASKGLTLLLEPLNQIDTPGYFYATANEAVVIIKRLGKDNVKLLYDTYHAGMGKRDIVAEIHQYRDYIGHIQIASVPGRQEPGRGQLDYLAIFAALEAVDYQGWIGCEYHPQRRVEDGLTWVDVYGLML